MRKPQIERTANATREQKDIRNTKWRIWKGNKRSECLKFLGNKCKNCGFSDVRALQIDHVNSDGHKEYKAMVINSYYGKVIESVKNKEGRYQLLCANCNWIKRFEKKEYSHL